MLMPDVLMLIGAAMAGVVSLEFLRPLRRTNPFS